MWIPKSDVRFLMRTQNVSNVAQMLQDRRNIIIFLIGFAHYAILYSKQDVVFQKMLQYIETRENYTTIHSTKFKKSNLPSFLGRFLNVFFSNTANYKIINQNDPIEFLGENVVMQSLELRVYESKRTKEGFIVMSHVSSKICLKENFSTSEGNHVTPVDWTLA